MEEDVRELRRRGERLEERVMLHREIGDELSERVRRVMRQWAEVRGEKSVAEERWGEEVRERQEEARRERVRVEQLTTRVQQMLAGKQRESHGEPSLGSAELARVQAELKGQTRSLEQLVQQIKGLRSFVREDEAEEVRPATRPLLSH